MKKPIGWRNESQRHSMSSRGIKTGHQYLSELKKRKEGEYFAQPIRASVDVKDLKTTRDIIDYVSTITHDKVKRWGGNRLIIDTKYRGIRGLIIVDPKKQKVDIFSRNLKPLNKFEKKTEDKILKDLSKYVKDDTIFDAELYALDKNGNALPQHTVTGYIKNPNDPKYKDFRTLIEVFDVVVVNKKDVRNLPLRERKKLLEKEMDFEGKVMYTAETKETKNTKQAIEKELREVIKEGGEGVVVKDPESKYFYGKPKKAPWIKAKNIDTIDLRMKSISKYPEDKAGEKKPFRYYRHMELVPEDDPNHIIGADKGVPGAGFDGKYFESLTKKLLEMVKKGQAKAIGSVPVEKKYQKIYSRKTVPKTIVLPKSRQPIFEIITEEVSKDLKPSGQKIVIQREDLKKADTKKTIKQIYKSFYKQRAPVKDFQKGGKK